MKREKSYHVETSQDDNLINLTPLIDVVFVVLIMFILIAPILEKDRVNLATSAEKADKETRTIHENSLITIHVNEDNSILINRKKTEVKDLLFILKMAKAKNPNQIPQLFHDEKASFGTYQTIKNAVEEAGFEQMDVILKPH